LSWKRLGLHDKPVVFVDIDGFWKPFFDLIDHTIAEHLTPGNFTGAWYAVGSAEEVVPLLQSLVTDDEPDEQATVRLT
jgi:predicted Rossmann-fold nucleotide-binding protein